MGPKKTAKNRSTKTNLKKVKVEDDEIERHADASKDDSNVYPVSATSLWTGDQYPYEVDYNDHFETPLQAYRDLMPLFDWWSSGETPPSNKKKSKRKQGCELTIYDPYYCNGRTKELLTRELGFRNVIHEKRDFYADIRNKCVPSYDLFVTNPPYSEEHKRKCFEYCFDKKRTKTPFCILLPNYVAARQYYRSLLENLPSTSYHVVYLVPHKPYRYEHPEGTGKNTVPFESMWFCGIPSEVNVQDLVTFWKQAARNSDLVASHRELLEQNHLGAATKKRLNPKQRKRLKKKMMAMATASQSTQEASVRCKGADNTPSKAQKVVPKKVHTSVKESKYRNANGIRTKKAFRRGEF